MSQRAHPFCATFTAGPTTSEQAVSKPIAAPSYHHHSAWTVDIENAPASGPLPSSRQIYSNPFVAAQQRLSEVNNNNDSGTLNRIANDQHNYINYWLRCVHTDQHAGGLFVALAFTVMSFTLLVVLALLFLIYKLVR